MRDAGKDCNSIMPFAIVGLHSALLWSNNHDNNEFTELTSL
jgi:hypothetical protein